MFFNYTLKLHYFIIFEVSFPFVSYKKIILSFLISFNFFMNFSAVFLSKLLVGSSKISKSLELYIALAIPILCFSPPDNLLILVPKNC